MEVLSISEILTGITALISGITFALLFGALASAMRAGGANKLAHKRLGETTSDMRKHAWSDSGRIFHDLDLAIEFKSVSISANGRNIVVGTDDEYELKMFLDIDKSDVKRNIVLDRKKMRIRRRYH